MLKPNQVTDRIYSQLKQIAIAYEIPPGHQIHIEDIANRLNVSVTPVREAMNRLLNEGYLVRCGSRGFYNRRIDLEELSDLFQLRGSMAISALHILLRTDLRDSIQSILEAPDDDDIDGDSPPRLKLCEKIIRAVGNREMIRLYSNISDRIRFVWDIYSETDWGSAQIETYRRDLYQALLARDIALCVEVIERNMEVQIQALHEVVQIGLARAHGGGFAASSRAKVHGGFRPPLNGSSVARLQTPAPFRSTAVST